MFNEIKHISLPEEYKNLESFFIEGIIYYNLNYIGLQIT